MAQDFYAAFGHDGVGKIGNDTSIASSDFDGINFIAIQALEKRTKTIDKLSKDIRDLQEENAALRKKLTTLESNLQKLETMFADWQNKNGKNDKKVIFTSDK